MPLADVYVQTPARLGEFFRQIRQGQAPRQSRGNISKTWGLRRRIIMRLFRC